ncbi:MAG: hypothetical protein ABIS47_06375 [Acidimicrobiales bacterium]
MVGTSARPWVRFRCEDELEQPEDVADEGRGGPVEESTASVEVPRADGEGDEVIRQQPVGHGQVLGGGEFPGPNEPRRGPEELEEG